MNTFPVMVHHSHCSICCLMKDLYCGRFSFLPLQHRHRCRCCTVIVTGGAQLSLQVVLSYRYRWCSVIVTGGAQLSYHSTHVDYDACHRRYRYHYPGQQRLRYIVCMSILLCRSSSRPLTLSSAECDAR